MARINWKCTRLMTFGRLFKPTVENLGKNVTVRGERGYSDLQNGYRIRNITEADIPKIAEIRKKMNLHDCLSSLYSFHKLDPEAIIVAEDDKGHIIGTHSMLNFAKRLYASGLTYVHHNYRKHHLALEMIRRETGRQRQNNRLMVSYTFKEWANNAEQILGFKMEIGFIAKRYISTENVNIDLLSGYLPEDVVIYPFEERHLDLICDYDLKVSGYERLNFLKLSCNETNTKTLIALQNGRCVGFGTIKLSCPGAKRVGPLYADNPEIAEALLKSLLERFQEGKGVVIIVPSPNLEAERLVNKLNILFNDGLYQIFEKGFPQADVTKAYAHFDLNGTSI